MDRMLSHYVTVLKGAATAPATPIKGLDLVSPDERELLVRGWNQTAKALPAGRETALAAFNAVVAAQPEADAVSYHGEAVTYAQLAARAEAVAADLAGRGIGPEDLVGVCCERSPWMIVGDVAAIKAGAAFVPL